MKKVYLFLLTLVASLVTWAEPVGRTEAMNVARAFLTTKGKAMLQTSQPYHAPRKGAKAEESAYYYVFNVGAEQGYVIVSGDDRTEEVLGYVDNGHFDANEIPENMALWLQSYADQIQHLDEANIQLAPRKARARKVTLTRHSVPVLMASRWNQGFPYNKNCPPYYKGDGTTAQPASGCVATALAQVINYYKYPEKIRTAIPAHSCEYTLDDKTKKTSKMNAVPRNTPIDWENMCDVYTGNETDAQNDAVANLMRYVGQMVKMSYGASSGASLASTNTTDGLRKYFGFDDQIYIAERGDYSADEWDELLYNELAAGYPIAYRGHSSGGGHAFVIDGYDGEGLFHVNWGWGGGSDGWFIISILNPGDNSGMGASTSSDGYSMSQGAIMGVRLPDDVKEESTLAMSIKNVEVGTTTIKARFVNWTGATNSFHNGIVEKLEDGTLKLVSNRYDVADIAANYYKEPTFDMAGRLKEGVHILSPASKLSTNKTYRPHYDMKRNYIEAVVDAAGNVSLRLVQPQPEVTVDTIVFPGTRIVNKEQEIRVTFRNTGDESFSTFYVLAGKSDDITQAEECTHSAVLVRKNEETVVSFYYKPTELGTYNVWVASNNKGDGCIGHAVFEAINEEDAVKPLLKVGTITIANTASDGTIYGNYLEGKVQIKNNMKRPYEGRISLRSWTQDYGSNTAYSARTIVVSVSIAAGATASVPFVFNDLRTDTRYRIVFKDVATDVELEDGGLWKHIWEMHPGLIAWKGDGSKQVLAASTTSMNSSWCAIYSEGLTSVSRLRPNKNLNTIYAYASGLTPSTALDGYNVVIGNKAEEINLRNDTAYCVPVDFTAKRATFSYTFFETAATGWRTFTMPITPDSILIDTVAYALNDEDAPFRIYEFSAEGDEGEVVFAPATELRANTPYLINCSQSMVGRRVLFIAHDQVFTKEGNDKKVVSSPMFRFYGTSHAPKMKDVYMLNADGTAFEYVSKSTALPAMSAYFTTLLSEETRPQSIPLCITPEYTDGIDVVTASVARPSDGNVYTLSGQKVANGTPLTRGIYIVGGRKVMVK